MFLKKWNDFISYIIKLCNSKIKSIAFFFTTYPQLKHWIKLIISCSSQECWVILNINLTTHPTWTVGDFWIPIKKQPSALAKPANQWGSLNFFFTMTKDLSAGIIFVKDFINSSVKPLCRSQCRAMSQPALLSTW